jgi:hypothetical protein
MSAAMRLQFAALGIYPLYLCKADIGPASVSRTSFLYCAIGSWTGPTSPQPSSTTASVISALPSCKD